MTKTEQKKETIGILGCSLLMGYIAMSFITTMCGHPMPFNIFELIIAAAQQTPFIAVQ